MLSREGKYSHTLNYKVEEENPFISQTNQNNLLSSNWQESKKIYKY